MSFWERIKQSFRGLMAGRHGADQYSMMLMWLGLALYLLGSIFGIAILLILGFACYCYTIFRMFSRNNEKRNEENRRYLAKTAQVKTKWKQSRSRFAHRKEYKYFKCPGCKAWLRLPHGAGVVTVTCSRCHNNFTQKA